MAEINLGKTIHRFGYTNRKDAWWVKPLFTFIGLSAFVIYVTWAAFQGKNYYSGPYLSHFIPLNFLVIRRIAGLVQSQAGGRHGYHGRLHCWYYGRRVYSVLPVIITGAHIIKPSGPIRLPALFQNPGKPTVVKILFH